MVIGTALDIMSKVTPPRGGFVDHPVGRTFGPPHDRSRNKAVLKTALNQLPRFTERNQIHDLQCKWQADGSRNWEAELRAEMLRDR